MDTIARRIRRLAPPSGAPYELFDSSVLMLLLAALNYIVTSPNAVIVTSLAAPLTFAPEDVWGTVLAGCGFAGAVCSYFPRRVAVGYTVVVTAALFWSTCFLIGVVVFDGPLRGLSSALIWGWIARRVFRESTREV